jgi:hypothetical protein
MRKSHFLLAICLSVCGSAFTEALAQWRLFHCARNTIEAYPEVEKRPVLQYLDEGRALADTCVRLFAEGRTQELYNLMRSSFRKETIEADFRGKIEAMTKMEGKIIKYDYSHQSLSYTAQSQEFYLEDVGSNVSYAVKTALREEDVYFRVDTQLEGKVPVIAKFELFFSPDVTAYLRSPQSERSGCPHKRSPLKVVHPK